MGKTSPNAQRAVHFKDAVERLTAAQSLLLAIMRGPHDIPEETLNVLKRVKSEILTVRRFLQDKEGERDRLEAEGERRAIERRQQREKAKRDDR